MTFRPKIIGFVCNWSLPKEVTIANPLGLQGAPKMHIVRVMCVGRIDPIIVLNTFAKGADGVLVIGCHSPDCHYIEGNLQAEQKIKMLKKLLSLAGLNQERLQLSLTYTAEIERFIKIIDDFRSHLMTLGQSPLAGEKPDEKVLLNVCAARNAAADFHLRVLLGRERELTEAVNVYGETIQQEEFDDLLNKIVKEGFIQHKIHILTERKPLSVKELASVIDEKPASVLHHIVDMRTKGMISLDHVEKTTPLYKALEVQ
ncbi:hydrogenase iron-sulfur subunit [Candidatus Bathyarchaeota archaeon]|nr:hydrogenase iron-sulfur subunit [Candidatus Bathyarchaeota archaeon]